MLLGQGVDPKDMLLNNSTNPFNLLKKSSFFISSGQIKPTAWKSHVGMEDMDDVALGLREALEAEHQWLLASIEEDSNGGSSLVGKQITKGFFIRAEWKGGSRIYIQSRIFEYHIFVNR